MMNEISREAKELVENVSELADDARRRCYQKDVCDELHQAQAELIDYIATIEAENARLKEELDNEQEHANDLWDELLEAKGELEKYDWKQGHPEHENEVLICTDNYGKKFYTTNSWKKGEYWNNLFQGKYIAYAEIRPSWCPLEEREEE